MNTNIVENLSTKANELLEYVSNTAKAGVDFMGDQIPLYVQELLAYEFLSAVGWATFYCFIIAIIIKIMFMLKAWIAELNSKNEDNFPPYALSVGCSIAILLFFALGAMPNIQYAIKIKVAPRVVLVEKAKEMVNGGRTCSLCGKVHN